MQPQRLLRLTLLIFALLALLSASLGAATSKLDLQTGSVTDPCVFAYMRANFRIDNRDSSAVNANTLTVRFYFNSAETVSTTTGFNLYVYNSAGTFLGWTAITATSTAMGSTCTLGGRSANRYVDYSFGSISIPAGGYASPNGGYVDITRAGAGAFDSACDDYSGTASTGFNQIDRMTLYQSGSLVCEYSGSSTQDPASGVEPCSGASACAPAASPTPTPSPAYSPTRTPSPTPVQSPTASASPSPSRTATPALSPTPTSTPTGTPAVYHSPTVTPTAVMSLIKSANVSRAVPGDTITYYLDWSNGSGGTVAYQIWDSLSPYLSYVGCDNGCTVSGSLLQWSFSAAAGSSGRVAFWARVSGYP